jgi:CRP-like cAMP-binding protein
MFASCSQYKDGLLSGAAFRQLSWGINTALDHCYNSATWSGEKETSFGDRFEWGWLISEGFLDPPKWLSYCKIFGSSFANHFTRGDDARRLELFLAISRAHEEVCKSESVLDPAFAAHLIQESQQIKVQADKQFAALALLSPDIASAVVTRQTCQLVLKDFLHEVENLYENAQLKATDFASMKEDILAKRRELLSYLPEADEKHVSNLRQENLRRYFPLDGHLIKKMTKKSFKAGEMILKGNLRADAIYFVEKGTVQLKLGEDEGDIAMFGDGCCINDTQVLLDDAGFDSQNVSDVIAVTEVSMHCLTFRSLSDISGHKLGKHEQDFFILKMWQYAGCLLSLRNPELFNFVMPPAGFQWASATMAIKEKGARLILSGRCLLVQGILEKRLGSLPPQNKLKRVNNKLEALTKGGEGFHAIEAFAYLSPTECDACVFIVKTDKCKLLLSPDAMCMDADESNVELSNRMKQASLPEDDDSTWNHHPLKDQPIWSCDYGCTFVGTAAAVRKHEQTCDLQGREQARSAQDLTIPRTESGPGSAGSSFITRFPSIMARRSSLITDSKCFISRTESEENKQRAVQRRSSIIVDPGSKQNALAKSRTPALQANGHTEDM